MLSDSIVKQIRESLKSVLPRKSYTISYDRVTGTPIISWNVDVNADSVFEALKNVTGINRNFFILKQEC